MLTGPTTIRVGPVRRPSVFTATNTYLLQCLRNASPVRGLCGAYAVPVSLSRMACQTAMRPCRDYSRDRGGRSGGWPCPRLILLPLGHATV